MLDTKITTFIACFAGFYTILTVVPLPILLAFIVAVWCAQSCKPSTKSTI